MIGLHILTMAKLKMNILKMLKMNMYDNLPPLNLKMLIQLWKIIRQTTDGRHLKHHGIIALDTLADFVTRTEPEKDCCKVHPVTAEL